MLSERMRRMIVLDYRDKRPIYEQVADKLEHLIVCGALESNPRLPSVRALAIELSVNPNTIQRAYTQLEQDGYLYTVVGRGNYVTCEEEWKSGKIRTVMKELTATLTGIKELGISKTNVLAVVDKVYSPEGDSGESSADSASLQISERQDNKDD